MKSQALHADHIVLAEVGDSFVLGAQLPRDDWNRLDPHC